MYNLFFDINKRTSGSIPVCMVFIFIQNNSSNTLAKLFDFLLEHSMYKMILIGSKYFSLEVSFTIWNKKKKKQKKSHGN